MAIVVGKQAQAMLSEDIKDGALFQVDPKKEQRMMLKFDLFAVSLFGLFYMMANLDRSNLGNANVAGLSKDLHLSGNQFGNAVTLLFATYVPFEAPVVLLLKIISPKYLMAFCAFAWGLTTLGMAFISDWRGLYTCRLLIGFFESGLFPSIQLYLGMVYKKSGRGRRSAMIFAFSALSSAFGGVLAYGLTQIHGPNGFAGWRWLFIVEALLTLLLVPLFVLFFPKTPTTAWFLDDEEKRIMQARYDQNVHWGNEEAFSWREVGKAATDVKLYAFAVYQFGCDVSLYGLTTFMPEIVRGLGYSSVHANLMTVPVYMVALFCFLVIAFFSDRTGLRGVFLIGPLIFLIIGYAILIAVDDLKARFFACFLAAIGIYPIVGLSMIWLQDNVSRHYKRASMLGLSLTVANTAGVAVGQIYTAESRPRYIKGMYISLGLACLSMLIVVALMIGMAMVNKRRANVMLAAAQAGKPLESKPAEGDADVHFRYTL